MDAPKVFVSHSHEDNEITHRLVDDLRARLSPAAVWMDESGGLHGGDEWWKRIVSEITTSDVFLVILSPNALASIWVSQEMDIAYSLYVQSRKRKKLIPVLYKPCTLSADWDGIHNINMTGYPETYATKLQEICVVLGLPPVVTIPPSPVPQQPLPIFTPAPPASPAQIPASTYTPAPRPITPPPVAPPQSTGKKSQPSGTTMSRRQLLVAGAAGMAAVGGIGLLIVTHRTGGVSSLIGHTSTTNATTQAVSPATTASPQGTLTNSIVPASLLKLQYTGYQNNGVSYIIPPMAFVPAGTFWMGSDSSDTQVFGNEHRMQVTLGDYEIGVYHLTVAEYALAIQANDSGVGTPSDWQSQIQHMDHPVVDISWLNALAYTQWLAKLSGQLWRMPTEAEWEKAARWDAQAQHSRIYPWGDQWDRTKANTTDGGPGTTTPVGYYAPGDASPYGCHDMAGNAWQWTSTIYADIYINDGSLENNSDTASSRVLRGGSWFNAPQNARVANRTFLDPTFVDGADVGFRLARGVGPGSSPHIQ